MNYPHLISMIITIAFMTAIMGEFKIYPIEASAFRLGLGSITFFLLILITNVPVFLTGIITAFLLLVFRTIIDVITLSDAFLNLFILNIPASLYYIVFAFCIDKLSLRKLKEFPLQLGIYGAIFELIANLIEHIMYALLIQTSFISWKQILILIVVALLRSFFVVGIYSSITINEQKKKMHEMLSLQTNLYTETLYMQQTMYLVEQVTADSFLLYKNLRETNNALSTEALRISSEMHEVKKNTQRVVAGLSNLMENPKKSSYSIMQLMKLAIHTHTQYSLYLNKNIAFELNGFTSCYTKKHLAILSILNNVLSNAVEAIDEKGTVALRVKETDSELHFIIENTGPPIRSHNLNVLFDAGFTTKFDLNGNASTGIGLYHVQTIINSLGGTIQVTSDELTKFHLTVNKQFL
jgi:signal transduction histidine kinase